MAFNQTEVNVLLAQCHRRCCICHRFCGVKIETDHMLPVADGGSDSIDNCLPVCFECHAEIHSYNDHHPRGRKFRPDELKRHKEQWLEICRTRPEVFTEPARDTDVGPLQALIDELEFNRQVAQRIEADEIGCLFNNEQFRRAVSMGAISIVHPELRDAILNAYAAMGTVNQAIAGWTNAPTHISRGNIHREVARRLQRIQPAIQNAHEELMKFLSVPSQTPAAEQSHS